MSHPEESKSQLIAFLRSASSYSHAPAAVHFVETHISWVLIASPFVFKVKKPVNLGFADFSTLEKRRYFCQRELELNRRLCPHIYLDVLPIYQTGDTFSFNASGEIVEYALKMRQLPDGWFLDQLLAKNAVGENEIDRIVARLHEFYAAESPTPEIETWGRPEKLKISTDENFAQIAPFVGKTISPLAFDAIRQFTDGFYAANRRLFEQRIQQRRVLDCHGDLRLDHVHITPDTVSIFDCIEFNDRFRFIDTANDLAFLAMDFDFAARHNLANAFLRLALHTFSDPDMLKLADFYKCYRAVVRGKVESIQAIAQHVQHAEEHARRATRYFRLALRYAVAGSEPVLFAIMGRVGTGKSTISARLAQELGWPFYSSDQIRKTLAGLPVSERTPQEQRGRVYSEEMTERTYGELFRQGFEGAAKSGAAVVDATFSQRKHRDLLVNQCRSAAIKVQLVELTAPDEQIRARLRDREGGSSEISDARLEDFAELAEAYDSPSQDERVIRIGAVADVETTMRAFVRALTEKQSRNIGWSRCLPNPD